MNTLTAAIEKGKEAIRQGSPEVEPDQWGAFLKWVSGGFVLLGSIATFFGVQGGILGRVLREYPLHTLGVFALVGVGVVLALVIPAVKTGRRVSWAVVALLVGVVLVAAILVAPDHPSIDEPLTTGQLLLVTGLVVGIGVALLSRLQVNWQVALICIAVTAVGSGLYAGTKLAVNERAHLERAGVVSSLATGEGQDTLTISAAGTELAGPVRVRVVGTLTGNDDDVEIAEQVLTPTRAGSLAASASVPIAHQPWAKIRVLACLELPAGKGDDESPDDATGEGEQPGGEEPSPEGSEPCEPYLEQASFAIAPRSPGLSGALTFDAETGLVSFAVNGAGFVAGDTLRLSAGAEAQDPEATTVVRVGPGGSVAWEGAASAGRSVTWVLAVERCVPEAGPDQPSSLTAPLTCEPAQELSTLRIPEG